MTRQYLFLALGVGATVVGGAFAAGCEGGDDGGSSGGAFTAPDSGFGSETSTSGGPTGEGGTGDGGQQQGDGAVDEPTTPVALINMATGTMHGAASADGSAIVISLAAGSTINVSLYDPATGWSAGAPIPTITTTTTIRGNAAVAMDGKGNAFVAWTTTTPDNHNGFYVARYDHATKTWGPAVQPDPYVENFGDSVAVSANASGDALVTAGHAGATLAHDFVMSHYSAATGTWSQETVLALTNDNYTDTPEVHLADDGKAVATAYPRPVALRDATGAWTAAPDVSATVLPTHAAINEAGDVIVAGHDADNFVYAYRYDATTAMWIPPVALSSTFTFVSGPCTETPGIQANGDGVIARCFDGDPKSTMESYTFTKATTTWSAVTIISEAGEPGVTTFTFDKQGNGVALYEDFATHYNAPPSPAVMNTFTAGTWSPQSAPLGGNINRDYTPAAFFSPNGRGFAVWGEGAGLHAKKFR